MNSINSETVLKQMNIIFLGENRKGVRVRIRVRIRIRVRVRIKILILILALILTITFGVILNLRTIDIPGLS